jgi:1,4-dihydroxy-6-naphthoate synthase
MSTAVRIGISPCPNDTFAFHALLQRRIETPGLDLEIVLDDVESLNLRFQRGELDAAKCSFAAALRLADRAVVLASGSALGFGVGPLLLAREASAPLRPDARVLCPGAGTTAALLFRLFHPGLGRVEHVRFSEILPAVARGDADFGVCIHEARFTFPRFGLALVEDLGTTWERATGSPLPLGGILARKSLGASVLRDLSRAVRASIDHAFAHREETLSTMRRHAQELDDGVLWSHVDLYVNERTRDLGAEGARALGKLASIAVEAGLLDPAGSRLSICRAD